MQLHEAAPAYEAALKEYKAAAMNLAAQVSALLACGAVTGKAAELLRKSLERFEKA